MNSELYVLGSGSRLTPEARKLLGDLNAQLSAKKVEDVGGVATSQVVETPARISRGESPYFVK